MHRNQSPLFVLIIALAMIVVFFVAVFLSLFGPNPTVQIASIGFGMPTATPTPVTFEAEQVVGKMYDALTNDKDLEYLDTMPMVSRGKLRPERILSGIIEQTRVNIASLEIPLEYLQQVSYHKMTYSGELQSNDYVLVHARGLAYLAALKAEYQMCDIWDVYRYEEGWLVDVDAPQRTERIQYLTAKRLQGKPAIASWPIIGWFWQATNESLEERIQEALYTCE